MQVVKETLSPCQVSLQITVEPDKVAQAVDKAYREFSKYISVPGFRKGHAPLAFVKPRVPQEQLRERTVELLTEPAYREAVEQEKVVPFAAPQLELVSIETAAPEQKFEFKALVPLAPKVELAEYKAISAERQKYEITDEAVDQRIDQMRERAAEYPVIADRGAEMGDIIVGDLTITPEDSSEPGESRPTVINIGDAGNLPGLDAQLIGLKPGDDKAFRLQYPDDFPTAEVAGQVAGFFVKVNELHAKVLPALDDDFAKKYSGEESLEAFKAQIKADLTKQMDDMAQSLVETKIIDTVVNASTIDFPEVLLQSEVEAEVKELLEDLKRRQVELPDYLARAGKTEGTLLEDFQNQAQLRIRRGLILGEIARAEGVKIEDADIDAEIAERAAKNRTSAESMRAYLDANNQMDGIARSVLTKKVLGFLTSSAIITDRVLQPGEEPTESVASKAETASQDAPAEEATKPKRARKKKDEAEPAA